MHTPKPPKRLMFTSLMCLGSAFFLGCSTARPHKPGAAPARLEHVDVRRAHRSLVRDGTGGESEVPNLV